MCATGTGPDDLRTFSIPTTTPEPTIGQAIDWLRSESAGTLAAVGIASFGPVDLDPASPTWGYITSTPKAGWQNCDLAGMVGRALNTPIGFNTDVNAAAMAEGRWGAATDVSGCLYITVGTGIGGGAVHEGRLLHGLTHPEMGHIRIPHDFAADPFAGLCPFHGDCLEGLASGPAIRARWRCPAVELPADHPAWRLEAHYLALAATNFVCTLSPARLILGGGVMKQAQLFGMVRTELAALLNGYIQTPQLLTGLDRFIVPPGLGDNAGVLGALILAEQAFHSATRQG